jgi:hypothetical protein
VTAAGCHVHQPTVAAVAAAIARNTAPPDWLAPSLERGVQAVQFNLAKAAERKQLAQLIFSLARASRRPPPADRVGSD